MTNRQPDPSDAFEDEGLASPDPANATKIITGDPQDDVPVPGDKPVAVDDFGTTAWEEEHGEPLDGRLQREEPDLDSASPPDMSDEADMPYPVDHEERIGRIVETDEGAREDDEATVIATDVGTDLGGFTAEERAMHIEPGA